MNGWNVRNSGKMRECRGVHAALFARKELIYNHKIAKCLLRNIQFYGLD